MTSRHGASNDGGEIGGVRPGQRLGLFGFGASALICLQVARSWGCRVFVCTRCESEQKRALSLGAEWAGAYDDAVPEPLDAAVTFAPVGGVVVAAQKALDRGGTVAINAIHLDGVPASSYDHARTSDATRASCMQRHSAQPAEHGIVRLLSHHQHLLHTGPAQ